MAATVEISETNGNANGGTGSPYLTPTVNDGILNINFGLYDTFNLVPAGNPMVLSIAGYTYSLAKWLQLHVSDMGGSAGISNLKVWKDSGVYQTAEVLGSNMTTAHGYSVSQLKITSYATTASVGGGAAVATPYGGNAFAIFGNAGFIETFPIIVAQPVANNLTIAGSQATPISAPGYSDFAYMQLCISGPGGTPTGPVNQKVIIFQYDES